jgi:hypothetical protein
MWQMMVGRMNECLYDCAGLVNIRTHSPRFGSPVEFEFG